MHNPCHVIPILKSCHTISPHSKFYVWPPWCWPLSVTSSHEQTGTSRGSGSLGHPSNYLKSNEAISNRAWCTYFPIIFLHGLKVKSEFKQFNMFTFSWHSFLVITCQFLPISYHKISPLSVSGNGGYGSGYNECYNIIALWQCLISTCLHNCYLLPVPCIAPTNSSVALCLGSAPPHYTQCLVQNWSHNKSLYLCL